MFDNFDDYDEEDEEDEELGGLSQFAYQGFGPVCLRWGCKHWGGDGLCGLAIAFMIADEGKGDPPDDLCPLG